MKKFFKMMFASMIGSFIALFAVSAVCFSIIGSILILSSSSPTVTIEKNSFLKLDLTGDVIERTEEDPISLLTSDYQPGTIGLNTILTAIDKAQRCKQIKGIYLTTDGLSISPASANEIRNSLLNFKKSGKFIYAYAENYGQGFYHIATVADKLYLNPTGSIHLKGIEFTTAYYKEALEKLGIEMQIFKVGTFKAAVEPFILDKMSDANRLQLTEIGQSIWKNISTDICASRKIEVATLNGLIDRGVQMDEANQFVANRLADSLLYRTDMIEVLKKEMKVDKEEDLKMVKMDEMALYQEKESKSENEIAVFYAVGEISDLGNEGIVSKEMIQDLKEIRDNEDIKALVFRVNSPGGSGTASEQIWYELSKIKERIPVIVSMGDLAASGGYYISCNATKIVAQPNTITGSIGVFGMVPNLAKLADKTGINVETVRTHKMSDPMMLSRPMNSEEKMVVQRSVDQFYEKFVGRCAQGRGVDAESIKKIAEGRIWSGTQALSIGLVDELGGLDKAIEIAAAEAKLKDYKITYAPEQKDMMEKLLNLIGGDMMMNLKLILLGSPSEWSLVKQTLQGWNPIQARMVNLEIE